MALKPTAGMQVALMQEDSWDVHRFSRDVRENRMEGVCIPAASFSRAENETFLCAKCLAQAEEQGICSWQRCRLPRMAQLGASAGHAGWAAHQKEPWSCGFPAAPLGEL